ncbi:MAG: hypothetical protein DMG24_01840 [Acidobacteria bacterium]|nr:MAG: hypothetical protein DMG24_01840 [Acidobacteriota bacterium]
MLTEVDGQKWLFSGDVVFYGGILGVINFEGSGKGAYRADLHKLRGLAVEGLLPGTASLPCVAASDTSTLLLSRRGRVLCLNKLDRET